jgi:hypothetical protein
VDDFCFLLVNDVMDLTDRDDLTSISLDLMLFILGGTDEGGVGGCELSMEDGLIVDSGITITKSLLIYNAFFHIWIFVWIKMMCIYLHFKGVNFSLIECSSCLSALLIVDCGLTNECSLTTLLRFDSICLALITLVIGSDELGLDKVKLSLFDFSNSVIDEDNSSSVPACII